jgi:hypothetical protein
MEIKIKIKNNYGRNLAYPVCHTAKTFARISGRETLTLDVLKHAELLGFKVKRVEEPRSLEDLLVD